MPKRYAPSPIFITFRCRDVFRSPGVEVFNSCPQVPEAGSIRVLLQWRLSGAKKWAVGVWAVRQVDVETLFDRVMMDDSRVIDKDKRMRSVKAIGNDMDGVEVLDAPKISLLCPVSGSLCG